MLAFIRFETQNIYLRKSGSVNKKVTTSEVLLRLIKDFHLYNVSIHLFFQNQLKITKPFHKIKK